MVLASSALLLYAPFKTIIQRCTLVGSVYIYILGSVYTYILGSVYTYILGR